MSDIPPLVTPPTQSSFPTPPPNQGKLKKSGQKVTQSWSLVKIFKDAGSEFVRKINTLATTVLKKLDSFTGVLIQFADSIGTKNPSLEKETPEQSSIGKPVKGGLLEKWQKRSPRLFSNAEEELKKSGKISLLISSNNQVFRFTVEKTPDGTLLEKIEEATIELAELESAGIEKEEAVKIKESTDKVLKTLFDRAMKSQKGRKQESAFYDRKNHTWIHLHVKKDGTITLGIERKVAEGTFKEIRKMVRCSIQKKVYALAFQTRPIFEGGVEKENAAMIQFKNDHIVQSRGLVKKKMQVLENSLEIEDRLAIKMDFYTAGDASNLTSKPLPIAPFDSEEFHLRAQVAWDAAEGLAHIHEYRDSSARSTVYTHNDVKPGNILLYKDEKGRTRAHIADLSPVPEGKISPTTQGYCSPEYLQSAWGPQPPPHTVGAQTTSDVWAFGLSLFGLFHNEGLLKPLFGATFKKEEDYRFEYDKVISHLKNDNRPECKAINQVIIKALQWDQKDRPPMRAICDDLRSIAQSQTESETAQPTKPPSKNTQTM